MAAKHPYVSTTGVLTQVLDHLQKSFPQTLNAETLKKLGFAPKNESYIINVIRFLGLIDDTDAKTTDAGKVFTLHDKAAFQSAFESMLQTAYKDLFGLYGNGVWNLGDDKLIPFFRQSDQTSDLVGSRQANTFKTLATYAGHAQPASAPNAAKSAGKAVPKKTAAKKAAKVATSTLTTPMTNGVVTTNGSSSNFGLTVRIEINLPSTGDQDTYDKIFKSIRENFLNG